MYGDFTEIIERLSSGDVAGLMEAAQIIKDFLHGSSDIVVRRWITHAIDVGSIEAVDWMIAQGVSINFRDKEGYAPLHSCIDRRRGDKYEVLARLIAAGADVNAYGTNFWTPLHMAAVREDRKAMKMLMDAGADLALRTTIDHYATPAEEARMLGRPESARFIERYAAGRYPFNG